MERTNRGSRLNVERTDRGSRVRRVRKETAEDRVRRGRLKKPYDKVEQNDLQLLSLNRGYYKLRTMKGHH